MTGVPLTTPGPPSDAPDSIYARTHAAAVIALIASVRAEPRHNEPLEPPVWLYCAVALTEHLRRKTRKPHYRSNPMFYGAQRGFQKSA
jgi:hypothetical protein